MQCRRNSGSSTTANLGQVPREDSGCPLAAWPADNCFAAAVTSINSPETGGAGGWGELHVFGNECLCARTLKKAKESSGRLLTPTLAFVVPPTLISSCLCPSRW